MGRQVFGTWRDQRGPLTPVLYPHRIDLPSESVFMIPAINCLAPAALDGVSSPNPFGTSPC